MTIKFQPLKFSPVAFPHIQRNGLRVMRAGEIHLAQQLYGHSIHYEKVWIHHGSFLPFDMQENHTAMTPTGEIWFEQKLYKDDFSRSDLSLKHIFMHELMHVWQKERGMNVIMRGLISGVTDYHYKLDKYRLSDYSMEQQASIVSDYWLLKYHGFSRNSAHNLLDYNPKIPACKLLSEYERVMGRFPN
nr:type IV secretion protein Rhs [uncultured Enterobacter sp.]